VNRGGRKQQVVLAVVGGVPGGAERPREARKRRGGAVGSDGIPGGLAGIGPSGLAGVCERSG
jgi:hypothetical protein